MGTVREEFDRLKLLINTGKENEVIHVVMTERVAAERRKNPKRSTIFRFDALSPEAYSELHAEKDRIFKQVVNAPMAVDFLIRAWKELTEETIKQWLKDGHAHPGDVKPGPPPPRAEIPAWLK